MIALLHNIGARVTMTHPLYGDELGMDKTLLHGMGARVTLVHPLYGEELSMDNTLLHGIGGRIAGYDGTPRQGDFRYRVIVQQ